MKKTLLTLAIAIASDSLYAQTNTFPLSGNVGIGTTSPTSILQLVGGTSPGDTMAETIDPSNGAAGELIIKGGNTSANRRAGIRFFSNQVSSSLAQWFVGASVNQTLGDNGFYFNDAVNNTALFLKQGGNVGIGTTTPTAKLEVTGIGSFISGQGTTSAISFGYEKSLYGAPVNALGSAFITAITASVPGAPTDLTFHTTTNGIVGERLRINADGNVGIGTTMPDSKLSVAGTIHSKEVKVDLTGWPDYVFKPSYILPSLSEVKGYIDKNNHLPDMPSEKEVAKNGLNLGEMNKLLIKKVEELTLYLIEENRRNQDQQNKLKQQDNRIETLEKALLSLTTK